MTFDGSYLCSNFGPWKRHRPESYGLSTIYVNRLDEKFDDKIYPNMDLDADVKRAAMIASPSVVSLVVSKPELDENDEDPFFCSGFIYDCNPSGHGDGGAFVVTILTSASLLRSSKSEPLDFFNKIDVHLKDGAVYEGEVIFCDYHYNMAFVKVHSPTLLPTCKIRAIDDSISIRPTEFGRAHSSDDHFHLSPGEMVIALGRYLYDHAIMAAPGKFRYTSVDACHLDCKELFRADCKITKCGIGGPLINRHGEVIGMNFYDELYTPFLPINVVIKCLAYFNDYRKCCQPRLGMSFTNLYVATLNKLEIVAKKFPSIVSGVLIEKVIEGSKAQQAGILEDDIIFQCDGFPVSGVLEFLDVVIYKTGQSVTLGIARASTGAKMNLSLVVEQTASVNELNRWPLPEVDKVAVHRTRLED